MAPPEATALAQESLPGDSPEAEAARIAQSALEASAPGGRVAPAELVRKIEGMTAFVSSDAASLLQPYTATLQQAASAGTVIATLPAGVGGQYDGSGIDIANTTVDIAAHGGDVHQTVADMRYTLAHELYHQTHRHEAPLVVPESEDGVVATIGGVRFTTQTALIEAVTVIATDGYNFVSSGYRQYVDTLQTAAGRSRHSLGEIMDAVNAHDLTKVDDAATAPQGQVAVTG